MSIHDNIRTIRRKQNITQEKMAELLEMSTSGYAKLERGENNLIHDKLLKIAELLNVPVKDLMPDTGGMVFLVNENGDYASASYYNHGNIQTDKAEIDKLNLIIAHKDEIIAQKNDTIAQKDVLLMQKDKELLALNEIIGLLKEQLTTK